MGLLDWAMPISQGIATGINALETERTNKQNLELQQEEWRREDSSYQRKVADLKAAGLNPALALGGGSPSSLAVRLAAPQVDAPDMTAPIRMNLARQQTAQTEAQTKLAQIQASHAAADAKVAVRYSDALWPYMDDIAKAEAEARKATARAAVVGADRADIAKQADQFNLDSLTSFGDAGSYLNNFMKVAQILAGTFGAMKGIR